MSDPGRPCPQMRCCGVTDYTDWFPVLGENTVPDRCCMENSQGCGRNGTTPLWRTVRPEAASPGSQQQGAARGLAWLRGGAGRTELEPRAGGTGRGGAWEVGWGLRLHRGALWVEPRAGQGLLSVPRPREGQAHRARREQKGRNIRPAPNPRSPSIPRAAMKR